MLLYAAIFLSSLIVAAVVVWLWRAIANAGKAFYQSILPSHRETTDLTRHLDTQRLTSTINDVPTPWGWKGDANPAQVARSRTPAPAGLAVPVGSGVPAPWGWSGNQAKKTNNNHIYDKTVSKNGSGMRKSAKEKELIGWPYQAEKTGFSGKINKASRIEKMRKNQLKTMNKPWGW